jgi:AraC-like DNA-binding protein
MSERSLERKFRQHIGISPKLFSRINRFQEAFRLLKNNNYIKLSDIAFDAGYTDQSHFIREFKEFTGFAPYKYQKEFGPINEDFPILIK